MNASLHSSPPAHGTVAVGEAGVTIGPSYLGFKPKPARGCSRKDIAGLVGHHPRNIKRRELRSPALKKGRISLNQRVLFYPVEAVVEFIIEAGFRVDLAAALRLGFPLTALPPDQFGAVRHGSALRARRTYLHPVSVQLVQQIQTSWATWQATATPRLSVATPFPQSQNSALDQVTVIALAEIVESVPSQARLTELARAAGRTAAQMELTVAGAAKRLRDQLHTNQGQLLFALLLAPHDA